jgi:hypothetical protein
MVELICMPCYSATTIMTTAREKCKLGCFNFCVVKHNGLGL